jgi:outer membrane protein OmpA-like peptidoglycan-associated protein
MGNFNLSKGEEKKPNRFNLSKGETPVAQVQPENTLKQLKGDSNTTLTDKGKKKPTKWWIWLLLLVIVIVLIIILSKQCSSEGNDNMPSAIEEVAKISEVVKPTTNENKTTDKPKVADNTKSVEKSQTADDDKAADDVGIVNPNESSTKKPTTPQTPDATQPNRGKTDSTKSDIPYEKSKPYKVYQFSFNNSDYSTPNPELDKLVKVLKENPSVNISILAYTDSVGKVWYNQVLSEQRANAIRNYLISKGINGSRITAQGKGVLTKYPANTENRRAEFIIN